MSHICRSDPNHCWIHVENIFCICRSSLLRPGHSWTFKKKLVLYLYICRSRLWRPGHPWLSPVSTSDFTYGTLPSTRGSSSKIFSYILKHCHFTKGSSPLCFKIPSSCCHLIEMWNTQNNLDVNFYQVTAPLGYPSSYPVEGADTSSGLTASGPHHHLFLWHIFHPSFGWSGLHHHLLLHISQF